MGNAVRTVGPPQAPKDRGYPRMVDHRGMESPKPALSDLPSGPRHRRSIGLSGMRGNSHVPFLGDGAWRQALLPDRPLRSRFRQQLTPGVRRCNTWCHGTGRASCVGGIPHQRQGGRDSVGEFAAVNLPCDEDEVHQRYVLGF